MYRFFLLKAPPDRGNLLLSKAYWMKDDSSTECFGCAERFTTFKRKHHCRLCGQIFCSKCTELVAGDEFYHDANIRVCKVCLSYNYEDSSDEEDQNGDDELSMNDDPLANDTMGLNLSNVSQREGLIPTISLQAAGQEVASTQLDLGDILDTNDFKHELRSLREKGFVSLKRNKKQKRVRNTLSKSSLTDDTTSIRSIKHNASFADHSIHSAFEDSIYKDLNQLSKYHLEKFLKQSLAQLAVSNKKAWLKALIRVISEIQPIDIDQNKDLNLDTTEYIKIKEVLGSSPKTSRYVNGLVFTKNVALKSMRSNIKNPKILIIKFPLEYSQGVHQFMSMDQLLSREKEYLNKLVQRILSLKAKPNILVAGSNISGYALELLNDAGITVLLNVKPQVIAHLARLTGADIVTSMERLTFNPNSGTCTEFAVKNFVFKNFVKTLAFFTGCNSSLGGTILIRDNEQENTAKVKTITEFILYCMFHLKLETQFFRNFFVSTNKTTLLDSMESRKKDIMIEGYFQTFVQTFYKSLYSISPSVVIPLPYSLQCARLYQHKISKLGEQFNHLEFSVQDCKRIIAQSTIRKDFEFSELLQKEIAVLLYNGKHGALNSQFKRYSRLWETFYSTQPNLLDVSTHQNICFSYSTINTKYQTFCFFPKVLQVEFYLDYNDCTLGQYIQQAIKSANEPCPEGCGSKVIEHHKIYYHDTGKLLVSVEKMASPITNLDHVILTFSACKKCGHKTPALPMDNTTWKFSFAKFLELSFLSIPLKVSFEECGHDALDDRIRYFCLNGLALKVEYDKVDLLKLVIPSKEINWEVEKSINLKIDFYKTIKQKIESLFKNIQGRLEGLQLDLSHQNVLVELAEENKITALKTLKEAFESSPSTDYIALNVALKHVQELCIDWNRNFSNFEKAYLSEFPKSSLLEIFKVFGQPVEITNDQEQGTLLDNEDLLFSEIESMIYEEAKQRAQSNNQTVKEELQEPQDVINTAVSLDNGRPKYTTKVSMVPKLKLSNSKVREKISQMEAMIANGNSSESSLMKSPSMKSPLSPLLKSPIQKDLPQVYPKVSKLKNYFDQLQIQFNKQLQEQREMEKKLYSNKYRSIPTITSKPMVYKNVIDAVDDDDRRDSFDLSGGAHDSLEMSHNSKPNEPSEPDEHTDKNDLSTSPEISVIPTDEPSLLQDASTTQNNSQYQMEERPSDYEKKPLFMMFKKLLADRSALWQPLDSPLETSEHVFADSDIIIREDEPCSLIAFSLNSKDYTHKVSLMKEETINELSLDTSDSDHRLKNQLLESQMLKPTAIHLKYQFVDDAAHLSCKVFFVEQFEALREKCGLGNQFVQSLSRCIKWDSSGGKSGSVFLKTLDDRLIIKQLSYSEMSSFVKMAPSYFEYMSQALFRDLPSVIARIFGFYQIIIKNPLTGKNFKMNVVIMENLFRDRKNLRIFDLKGSMRNRHVEQTGKENEVLLDENMVDYMFDSPLLMRYHDKKLLKASLWNDTLFLSKMNVMDYSLVVGIDSETNEIVTGLIDYVRTFTWDKKLESWVKEKGFVGGGGKRPTVVTPKEYKSRFRAAMDKYVILVPDSWHISTSQTGN